MDYNSRYNLENPEKNELTINYHPFFVLNSYTKMPFIIHPAMQTLFGGRAFDLSGSLSGSHLGVENSSFNLTPTSYNTEVFRDLATSANLPVRGQRETERDYELSKLPFLKNSNIYLLSAIIV